MKMISVFVQSESDVYAKDIEEERMPVLVIQQAAQGEVHGSISRGHRSIASREREKNS